MHWANDNGMTRNKVCKITVSACEGASPILLTGDGGG